MYTMLANARMSFGLWCTSRISSYWLDFCRASKRLAFFRAVEDAHIPLYTSRSFVAAGQSLETGVGLFDVKSLGPPASLSKPAASSSPRESHGPARISPIGGILGCSHILGL